MVGPDAAAGDPGQQTVDAATGLSTAEADSRRAKFGANKFADAKKEPRWQAFVRQYRDPMQVVLLVAGISASSSRASSRRVSC